MRPPLRRPPPHPAAAPRRRLSRPEGGFSLVEMATVLAVVGVLLGAAAPSLHGRMLMARVEGAANELGQDLLRARSEALRRAETVTVEPLADGTGWRLRAGSEILKEVALPARLRLVSQQPVRFEALRGAAEADSQHTVGLADAADSAEATRLRLRAEVNTLGRLRLCLPDAAQIQGYPRC